MYQDVFKKKKNIKINWTKCIAGLTTRKDTIPMPRAQQGIDRMSSAAEKAVQSAAKGAMGASGEIGRSIQDTTWFIGVCITQSLPIGSMYAIYGNIYHQYFPNVSIYTIHGSYGL